MRMLVTGFGAFRDIESNPSQWLAERVLNYDPVLDLPLNEDRLTPPIFNGEGKNEPNSIRVRVLEVSYAAVDEFVAELDRESFDAWLMMGVHGSAERMHLECVARNWCGVGADVRGEVRGPGMIDPSLPGQLHGNLFAGRWEGVTIDAGGYLCNYLFFRGVSRFPAKRIGFLHVPRAEVMGLEDQWVIVRGMIDELTTNIDSGSSPE
jgi:pyrrolidone-carboxylate peptidase